MKSLEVMCEGLRSPCHLDFQGLYTVYLTCCLEVKRQKGQGQRSHDSRSEVKGQGQHVKKNVLMSLHSAFYM